MNELSQLSATQLRRAAELKDAIERLQIQLNAIIGTSSGDDAGLAAPRRRHMSPAARARIAAGARARWANLKDGAAAGGSTGKRKMSAAAKARLSALAKERWKKAKAAGKHKL